MLATHLNFMPILPTQLQVLVLRPYALTSRQIFVVSVQNGTMLYVVNQMLMSVIGGYGLSASRHGRNPLLDTFGFMIYE